MSRLFGPDGVSGTSARSTIEMFEVTSAEAICVSLSRVSSTVYSSRLVSTSRRSSLCSAILPPSWRTMPCCSAIVLSI